MGRKTFEGKLSSKGRNQRITLKCCNIIIHCLFLTKLRCDCHDHTMRNSIRNAPTDVQKVTSHNGIGLGYSPGRIKTIGFIKVDKKKIKKFELLLIEVVQKYFAQDECTDRNIPCPNLMQMRSSTMQIAMESQQNEPTFFTGFLQDRH